MCVSFFFSRLAELANLMFLCVCVCVYVCVCVLGGVSMCVFVCGGISMCVFVCWEGCMPVFAHSCAAFHGKTTAWEIISLYEELVQIHPPGLNMSLRRITNEGPSYQRNNNQDCRFRPKAHFIILRLLKVLPLGPPTYQSGFVNW